MSTARTEERLLAALRSGRWAVSGAHTGEESFENTFAQRFAEFVGTAHAVPTCNGSAALTIAIEALGVGAGDEVLVPGLTWVACASAVLRVGAVPVLVDVEPDTLCMSVAAAEAAITPRTRLIMPVHVYGSAVDMDAMTALAGRHGIPVLEDCSHVHGARWRGRRLGSLGQVGAFSLQQTKLLTSGEGGVAVTSDPEIHDLLSRKRADGRRRRVGTPVGELELEELPGVQGYNYCMSEFNAAVALDGLDRLDGENARRRVAMRRLDDLLAEVEGASPLSRPAGLTEDAAYQYCVRLAPAVFGQNCKHVVAEALSRELGLHVEPIDSALTDNVLYQPLASGWTKASAERARLLDPRRFRLPVAEREGEHCVLLPHRMFLAPPEDIALVADALRRVRDQLVRV
ncbi:L-glutamine:scyllo-inosose aminotransferase [Streptoalloteichus tenebrarius]|uniref:L-glutamine:scyllo-inosose aminotransferase n=1 Tax=Streptoalloteichus tenebrarius (strain ATCC 17920 / DSM 40477 / JCM 4838 / CBS 697.72 / NBRC 16177 / NCIMB 11028 / NRRL B-12390 / A12253. 1 / ISP 5477) TaxID=1933 RepID=A0ABT1HS13_STRSD|nr:DegT/DnrJ/EryC1/StrS family aminotransferase [Streptoalloteichus tenebrarius]MCP2258278.1 L-glutamine:scyllo-inosose aminotransferase [Streptoalloteichus tenebrarius]BFF04491.1 UDP-4-amino-4-deoxy-L-arabinose aminotransferase [Streptoalloteichus tenebrarius]